MSRSLNSDNRVIPEIVARAERHLERLAVVDGTGDHTYEQLLKSSAGAATALLDGAGDLREARVAYMVTPSFDYVRAQWGIWRAGGVAAPLCLTHPRPELEYVLDDTRPISVVAGPEFEDVLRPLAEDRGIRWLGLDDLHVDPGLLPAVEPDRRAMILYTSGTTGPPKGVVTTHRNISAQIRSLVEAWAWTPADRVLLTLPLHHVHGIVNVVSCALWSGAVCEMLPKFDAADTWNRIASAPLTLYMAVPTIYHRLIETWERAEPDLARRLSLACQRLRLMVSGSAALPVPVLERWKEVSGHTLLERYGMTEIGMALSNPLHGQRRPGHVGSPLPGVEVRLAPEEGEAPAAGDLMEIQVRGETVFLDYWGKPEATRDAFTIDGWFKTGDMAVKDGDVYQILGRSSVDIIKSGGEKVSALEVESTLLGHPSVAECAVVGMPDPEWGQRVVAAVVQAEDSPVDHDALKAWCRDRLAPYKVPKEFITVDALPTNAMGKVNKPELVTMLGG